MSGAHTWPFPPPVALEHVAILAPPMNSLALANFILRWSETKSQKQTQSSRRGLINVEEGERLTMLLVVKWPCFMCRMFFL